MPFYFLLYRIVTGVRFYKQNRIIHMQIQEGKLMERGRVNSTTVRWVPVEDYSILDKGIRDGLDYHTLAWDRREVDLDDLTAPAGHVIVSLDILHDSLSIRCFLKQILQTGVKFRVVGRHLNLEIRVSEINFR